MLLMRRNAPQKSKTPKSNIAKESRKQTERQTSMSMIMPATANHIRSLRIKAVDLLPLHRTTVNVKIVHLNANLHNTDVDMYRTIILGETTPSWVRREPITVRTRLCAIVCYAKVDLPASSYRLPACR